MKYSLPILSVFLLFFSTQTLAQDEQLSDFEIQKQFKAQYQIFQNKIDTSDVADTLRALQDSIAAFAEKYQPHAELLDDALYPETFEQKMKELKSNAQLAANRLQKMNQQDEQLTSLQLRLLAYQEHVSELTEDADSLRKAMEESIQSEKRLSGMVRNYRKNLEERDELILSFIDSTVVAYQKMDLKALRDLENLDRSKRLETDGDALKMIRDISSENLNILQENSDRLRLDDFMRMQNVQQRFEQMWNRMGDKIANVYGGSNAGEIQQQVTTNVAKWDSLLNEKTFTTLNDSLWQRGLQVDKFENADGFYNSLNSYLDNQIKQSKEGASEQNYRHFKTFNDFWSEVERKWSNDFQNADIMSDARMATISNKTDTWSENARPESRTMLYLLIGVGLLAIILGGLLIREKNKNKS